MVLCFNQTAKLKLTGNFQIGNNSPPVPKQRLNLALGHVTSCWSHKLHVWNLNTVGWGQGPLALVTLVKAIRLGVKNQSTTTCTYFLLKSIRFSSQSDFKLAPEDGKMAALSNNTPHQWQVFNILLKPLSNNFVKLDINSDWLDFRVINHDQRVKLRKAALCRV